MAPEAPKQKRKRGRPAGASTADEDASGRETQKAYRVATETHRADHEEQDDEEAPRPRKRGRPSKGPDTTETTAAPSEKAPRRRKGRASNASQEEDVDHENEEAQQQPVKHTRKRGRPLKESVGTGNKMRKRVARPGEDEEAEVEDETPSSGLRRSNRERRSWNAEEIFSAKIPSKDLAIDNAPEPSKPRRRVRVSKEGLDEENRPEPTETRAEKPKRKRGRPSLGEENANVKKGAKRRGRLSVAESQEVAQEEPSQPRRRGRTRTSDASQQEAEPSESQEPARRKPRRSSGGEAPSSKPRARKSRPSEPEPAVEEEEEPPYRHLKSQTRQVSRKTIEAKWAPLNPPAIAAITSLLSDAQRPVLLRLQDTRNRREHASAALSVITRRLRSKLVKGMPFPPPTATTTSANRTAVEDDFDFERTVDGIQALENALNPLLHSVALLESEKAKEQAALEKDYAALNTLVANARAEVRGWRERRKREHPLAPAVKKVGEADAADEQPLELVKSQGAGSGSVFQDLQDEELISISKQIGSHMDSMKGNLQQIDGVIPAITKSKAALQRILHQNLDAQQYEQVLLG